MDKLTYTTTKKYIYSVVVILFILSASVIGLFDSRLTSGPIRSDPPVTHSDFEGISGWFTENQGQIANDSIRFTYSHGDVAFLESEILFVIRIAGGQTTVRLSFPGANTVNPIGENELLYPTNYILSDEPNEWQLGIRNFQRVVYQNVYEGIDLVFYSTKEGLKYDWLVRPGSNPGVIIEQYGNIQNIYIDTEGDLIIVTPSGKVTNPKPVSYQDEMMIASNYRLVGENTIGYDIEYFNQRKLLTIDPLIYSTYIGGFILDKGQDIAVDRNGNAYVTGYIDSADVYTPLAFQTQIKGGRDAFVAKLSQDGKSLIYFTYLGGSDEDVGKGITVDSDGNVYVTGYTESLDYPVTSNAYNKDHGGLADVFISKLSPDGKELLYSTFIGGKGFDGGSSITLDKENNIYIGGSANAYLDNNDTEFPYTYKVLNQSQQIKYRDAFVLKLSVKGDSLLYSILISGNSYDAVTDISLDNLGNLYATGNTKSTDFPINDETFDSSYNGEPYSWGDNSTDGPADAFVFKINTNGTELLYSTYLGGENIDGGEDITVDKDGYAYLIGTTYSIDFPTTLGSLDNSYNGGGDIFVTKLSIDGSHLIYSTFVGGPGLENGEGIAIDGNGTSYLTGSADPGFPITKEALDETPNGWGDAFVAVLSENGSYLKFSTFLGGDVIDTGVAITLDQNGYVYITGWTKWKEDYSKKAFPTTSGAYDTTHNGNSDIFIVKLDPTPGGRLDEDKEGIIPAPELLSVLAVILVVVIIGRRRNILR